MNVATLLEGFPGSSTEEGFSPTTVDVAAGSWVAALLHVRDDMGCRFFDFLSAVDLGTELRVVCHVASSAPFGHVLLRTTLSAERPRIASVAHVYAGAGWHERETAEMFGIAFLGSDGEPLELPGLLLPPGFEGHPLRKEHLLTSRNDRPWPGAKEPGESDADVKPSRRRLRPPGVPDPTRRER